jgi:predicted metal-dependent peptidase
MFEKLLNEIDAVLHTGRILGIGIDVSGSSGDVLHDQYIYVLNLIRNRFPKQRISLVLFDNSIIERRDIGTRAIPELPVLIGGGTDFRKVIEEFNDTEICAAVILTDGFGSLPDGHMHGYHLIWAVFDGDKKSHKLHFSCLEPFGEVVMLPVHDFKNKPAFSCGDFPD